MAQDKLGSIVRALVGVPQERFVVVQRVVNNLNSASTHGDQFEISLSKFVQDWKPKEPKENMVLPEFQPNAEFYKKLFGKVPDFSGLAVPKAPDDGKYIAVVVAKELVEWTKESPKEGLFQARKKLFPTWKYDNDSLDVVIPMDNDQRDLRKGSYVVLMRDSETPDSYLMNLSANQIADMKVATSTDTEYALFSGTFFLKHGYHPDRKTWTLNSGSRHRDGDVPGGLWRGRGSYVGWCNPTLHDPCLGSRKVWI